MQVLDTFKPYLKTLGAAFIVIGGLLAFPLGVKWAADTLLGKSVSNWVIVFAVLLAALGVALWFLWSVANKLKVQGARNKQLLESQKQLCAESATASARVAEAEGKVERLIKTAREQGELLSAENLLDTLIRARAQVILALQYAGTRRRWDQRQVRVLSLQMAPSSDGRTQHVAEVLVGGLHGAAEGLRMDVAAENSPIAYGSIVQVIDGQHSFAALEPYERADGWAAVSADLELRGKHIPQNWIVTLSQRQTWSELHTGSSERFLRLSALVECVERMLAGASA